MPRSRARIALIQRPVNDSIEKHGGGAREYHADDHQQKNSRRRPAVRRHDQRGKSKGERENRMRKTNQPKKSSNPSVSNLSHECNRKLLVPGSTGCQPVVAGSLAGKIFAPRSAEATPNSPGLGKLPRPAGWQPALPRKRDSRSSHQRIPSSRPRARSKNAYSPA